MKERDRIVAAFSEMAPRYEEKMNNELNRFWGWNYDEFVNRMLKNVHIRSNDSILDVATGTSFIPVRLIKTTPDIKQIVGLDITLDMLLKGKQKISALNNREMIEMVCGNALAMPLANATFNIVLCGLATHHMDVKDLLTEIYRLLKPHGKLAIADVGGSKLWKNPIVRFLVRILAFTYFFFTENKSRAWIEASALTNIRTAQEWKAILLELGFDDIAVSELQSKKLWVPNPLIIYAKK
jgi:ubiquinone/menaquinone biosynthesis C-methylase UbiE